MEITPVHTQGAPTLSEHYLWAVVYNGLVFVAGQLAIDPRKGEKRLGSIEEQMEQAPFRR